MTEYGYFTSYARADGAGATLAKVVEELGEQVRSKLGLAPDESDDLWFFDQTDITTGEVWDEKLRSAANNARVLVCLCTKTYLSRPHCAKEFEIFRLRVAAASGDEAVIVPILWEHVRLPAALSRYQETHDQIPGNYRKIGLRRLRELKSHRDRYLVTLDALAEVIADRVKKPPIAPLDPLPRFAELPAAFHNPGQQPLGIAAIVLHPDGPSWRVDKFNDPLQVILDRVADGAGVSLRVIPVDPKLERHLPIGTSSELVVVIAEQRRLAEAEWANYQRRIDEAMPDARWFIGVASGEVAERGESFPSPGGIVELTLSLSSAIRAWVSSLPANAARSDDAERSAEARGVDISSPPTIVGPARDTR